MTKLTNIETVLIAVFCIAVVFSVLIAIWGAIKIFSVLISFIEKRSNKKNITN